MEQILAMFGELPGYLKLVVVMSVVVPILGIYNYLNPPPPPPVNRDPEITVIINTRNISKK